MAGDWIKMRGNLWDDPRVARLVEETDQSEAAVIGGLYWLWATADQHSSDGLLHGMTTRTVDRKTGVPGLGQALVGIGWLSETDEGVTVSRFDEHNGASAKTRAQTAKRVANHKGNAKVTHAALPEADKTVSSALPREREEKEKEENPTSIHSATAQPELREDAQDARPEPAPATLLSIEFNAAGIRTQPADPRLLALAEQGVSRATVAAACVEAKAAKPGETIGLGYVLAILQRWSADATRVQAGRANTSRQTGPGAGNEKFNFSHLDRSGDRRAMDESMQRHGITMPTPDQVIEI